MSSIQEKHPKDITNISEENKSTLPNSLLKTSLEKLGYDEWFDLRSKDYLEDNFTITRIVEVNKNNFKVSNGRHEIFAELSGKFLFNIENSIGSVGIT